MVVNDFTTGPTRRTGCQRGAMGAWANQEGEFVTVSRVLRHMMRDTRVPKSERRPLKITFMDTSSAESRDRLRRAIDDEIISSEESTRVLKSRRNALALISCLPPETLAAIFSFLFPEWNKEARYLEWIHVAHVCRRWREAALCHPRFWSHVVFTKLTSDGVAEILSRAKMAPLHLEADFTRRNWPQPRVDAIAGDIEAHISHTRRLKISGPLRSVLEQLTSSAPTLESISLLNLSHVSSQIVIPANLFNCTTPSLSSLELENCDISWKSPLLKGLRTLEILRLSTEARPKLEDWLATLDEMPLLETLVLNSATPLASSLTSHSSRIVTLPSLTKFHISASAKDSLLALTHLVFPALTCLYVDAKSQETNGEDVQQLIPYFAQNAFAMQDTEPLRSILIDGNSARVEVLAWTTPDADLKFCDPKASVRASVPARFKFAATGRRWRYEVNTVILDSFLTHFPVTSVLTLTTRNKAELTKSFWVRHAPKLSLIERASLVPTTIKGFRDMLAEHAPPDGPRLPALTKLILDDILLTDPRAYDLRDMLVQREEQGVALLDLDLRTSFATRRAIQLLEENVVDLQEPDEPLDEPLWPPIEEPMGWHVQGPWSRDSDEDNDEDEEDGAFGAYLATGNMDYYEGVNYEVDYW